MQATPSASFAQMILGNGREKTHPQVLRLLHELRLPLLTPDASGKTALHRAVGVVVGKGWNRLKLQKGAKWQRIDKSLDVS